MVWTIEEAKRKAQLNAGFFETNQYTEATQMPIVSGDFDGAGLSVGNLQYNFGPADRAQEFLKYMVDNHLTVVQNAFGANTADYDEFVNVINTYTRAQRITWASEKTDRVTDPDERTLFQPYETALGVIANSPEGIVKYRQMADTYYWVDPFDLFRQLSCTSKASLCSLYDITVNKGRYYPINLICADFDVIDANGALTPDEKEAQKIYQINVRGNSEENALNDTSSGWFEQRRMCMANQGGTYYGSLYDPEVQFGVDQTPAIAEKAGATLGVKLGSIDVENVFLGTTPITAIYLGADLLGGLSEPYTTSKVPQTQFRTNPNSYAGIGAVSSIDLEANQPLWIDVQNYVACRTFFTIDGSTPTTASTLYTGALMFEESCTLKTLTVSVSGVSEAVKTLTVAIPADIPANTFRFVRFDSYGSTMAGAEYTTRAIELEVWSGGVNRLSGKPSIAPQPAIPDSGNKTIPITSMTDGVKGQTSNTYPVWWTTPPNGLVVFDMGAEYPIEKIVYVSLSYTGDQRAYKFKIKGSNTNNGTDWVDIWDMSANTTPQPVNPAGYEIVLESAPPPPPTETFNMNFFGKLKNDFSSNPHYAGGVGMQGQVMPTPATITSQGFEISGANYTKFGAEENAPTNATTYSAMGDTSRLNNYYRWDIIKGLEIQYGPEIWGTAVTVPEKMVIVKEKVTGLKLRHNGFGSGGGLNFAVWNGTAYSTPSFKDNGTNSSVFTSLEWDISADVLSDDGYIHTLIFTPDGTSTILRVDYVEMQVTAII